MLIGSGERMISVRGSFGDGDMFLGVACVNRQTGLVRVDLASTEGILPRGTVIQFHVACPPEPLAVYSGINTKIVNGSFDQIYKNLGNNVAETVTLRLFPGTTLPQSHSK